MGRLAVESVAVTALNVLGQAAGFLLYAVIAGLFGADARTDAFFLALTIPALFYGPVVNAISSVLIPQLTEWRLGPAQDVGRRIGTTLLWVGGVSLAAMALVGLTAGPALDLAAPSISAEARAEALADTLRLLSLIPIQGVAAVLAAVFQAWGRFRLPVIAVVARQVGTLTLVIALQPALGARCLPLAFVGGSLLQLATLARFWRVLGLRLAFGARPEPDLARALRLALPLIGGSAALQLGLASTRFLAAGLPEGSVSVLDYAGRISTALLDLLSGGALMVAFVDWSRAASEGALDRLRVQVRRAAQVILFVLVPLAAVLIACRHPVVELLLARGKFSADAAGLAAATMAFFFAWIPVEALGQTYVRLLLAWKETWRIGILATARLAVVVSAALALVGPLGVRGLAYAELLASAATSIAVILVVSRRLEENPLPWLVTTLAKTALCALAAYAVAAGIAATPWPAALRLALAGTSGAGAALGVALILRHEPLQWIRAGLSRAPGARTES